MPAIDSADTQSMLDKYALKQATQYSFEVAQWIAQEHSLGDSLQALHEAHSDMVPAPLVIARWRREFPAFDLVMREAERARAAKLAEEVLTVADNTRLPAAKTANKIRARQWLASKLDPARFGKQEGTVQAPTQANTGNGKRASLATYSDEELQEIIRAHLQANSIEGESERQTPGDPPARNSPGLEAKDGRDTSEPNPIPKEPSVTYNADSSKDPRSWVTDDPSGAQHVSQDGTELPEF